MSVSLKVRDETARGEVIAEAVLRFPAERISVRELIETRVEQEIERYHASTSSSFNGLIQPTEAEQLLNGPRTDRLKLDAEKQKKTAIEAFGSNGFFLFLNDRQLTELDQSILITPNSQVSFLRLIPLVGG